MGEGGMGGDYGLAGTSVLMDLTSFQYVFLSLTTLEEKKGGEKKKINCK